jgi:hypothetical protein
MRLKIMGNEGYDYVKKSTTLIPHRFNIRGYRAYWQEYRVILITSAGVRYLVHSSKQERDKKFIFLYTTELSVEISTGKYGSTQLWRRFSFIDLQSVNSHTLKPLGTL